MMNYSLLFGKIPMTLLEWIQHPPTNTTPWMDGAWTGHLFFIGFFCSPANLPINKGSKTGVHPIGWPQKQKMRVVHSWVLCPIPLTWFWRSHWSQQPCQLLSLPQQPRQPSSNTHEVFFLANFLPNFKLKNMISTYTKDFSLKKISPN